MTSDAPRTPPNSPDHPNLRRGIRWSTLFGLAAAALLFASIYISGGEAATAPTLGAAASYSVLGATTVTCTESGGQTEISGDVGVSTGTAITGFPDPCNVGPPGTTHSNDASAIAAQADNLILFNALDAGENADANCIGGILPDGTDLTLLSPLVAGLYCSAGSFLLTGDLTLAGSGVWVFKTVSGLTTSPGSSVSGGDPCDVWWRIGSSAVLGTTTSFVGNILALTSISLETDASLDGRVLAQNGAVTLDSNTITTADCAEAEESTPTSTSVPGTATSTPSTAPAATSTPENTPVSSVSNSPSPGPTATSTGTVTSASPGEVGQPPQAPVLLPPQAGDGGLLQTRGSGLAVAGIGFAAVALLAGMLALILRSNRGQPGEGASRR